MAASVRNDNSSMFSGINVTPLVDVMLVLLVIFMVTAKLIVSQTLPMDLPHAATGGEQQIVFSVAMNAAGEMTIDSRRIENDAELLSVARKAHSDHADLRAVIHADTSVSHGRVVRVMDLLKQAGIGKIAFGITPAALESEAK